MANMYKVELQHRKTAEKLTFKVKAFSESGAKSRAKYLAYRTDDGTVPEGRNYQVVFVEKISKM